MMKQFCVFAAEEAEEDDEFSSRGAAERLRTKKLWEQKK